MNPFRSISLFRDVNFFLDNPFASRIIYYNTFAEFGLLNTDQILIVIFGIAFSILDSKTEPSLWIFNTKIVSPNSLFLFQDTLNSQLNSDFPPTKFAIVVINSNFFLLFYFIQIVDLENISFFWLNQEWSGARKTNQDCCA